MQLFSRAAWPLVASLACLGTVVDAAGGVLEVDLLFPRNETYAPTDSFPVLFAFQNAKLAWNLGMHISYAIHNRSDLWGDRISSSHELRWANWSSYDPYFVGEFFSKRFTVEGEWQLYYEVGWGGCLDKSLHGTWFDPTGYGVIWNSSSWSVDFTISSDGQPMDLVAATANKETCTEELGTAIKVTGKTQYAPLLYWDGGDTCPVLDISSPTPTPNPCAIKIDSATAASISASWTAGACNVTFPPDYCPPENEDNASQRLAVAGVASLAAAFGAFGFLLL